MRSLPDASGTTPFVVPGTASVPAGMMLYHEPTNSLLLAQTLANSQNCAGMSVFHVTIRRLPLSAEGSRVAGPVACSEFIGLSASQDVVGFQWKDDGDAILVVDTNSSVIAPRILKVDPNTLAMTTFATPGGYFAAAAAALWGGGWSTLLGRAIILDPCADAFRTYAFGDTGNGLILPTSLPPSTPVTQNDTATLLEIPFDPCSGGLHGYGTGKTGKGGWIPALAAAGCPTPGATIEISLASIVGGAIGVLFVGVTKAAVRFLGGSVLVSPVALTLPQGMPGTPGVAGARSVIFPTAAARSAALGDHGLCAGRLRRCRRDERSFARRRPRAQNRMRDHYEDRNRRNNAFAEALDVHACAELKSRKNSGNAIDALCD